MKWYLLKSNKCPKCSSYLEGGNKNSTFTCSKPSCDFKIGEEKFLELSNTYAEKYRTQDRFNTGEGWSKFSDDKPKKYEDPFDI